MRGFRPAASLILMVLFFAAPGFAQEDTRAHISCKYCNMNREAFAHSRMLIEYSDGTSVGTCSIHCSAVDMIEKRASIPCRIMVGDYGSKKLIDATAAFWVIGGDKPGVMTDTAKWAFEKQAEAAEFVKKHGGKRATFQEALRAAYDGLYEDMKTTIDRVKERKSRGWDPCNKPGQ